MLVIKLINDHAPPTPHPYAFSFSQDKKIVWDQTCRSPEGGGCFTSTLCAGDYILHAFFFTFSFFA